MNTKQHAIAILKLLFIALIIWLALIVATSCSTQNGNIREEVKLEGRINEIIPSSYCYIGIMGEQGTLKQVLVVSTKPLYFGQKIDGTYIILGVSIYDDNQRKIAIRKDELKEFDIYKFFEQDIQVEI